MNTRVNSSGSAQKKLLAAILMAASVPGNGSLGTAGEVVLKSWCGRGDGSLKRIIFVSGKGQKASRPVPSLHYTMQWENAISSTRECSLLSQGSQRARDGLNSQPRMCALIFKICPYYFRS